MRSFLERASLVWRWKVALASAVVLAILGGAVFFAYGTWNEAGAQAQRVRWGNVTITIPADSEIYYARLSWAPQSMARGITGLVLALGTGGDRSLVIVDATTGEVAYDDVVPAERAAFDAVLATLEVATTDVAAEPSAPWPYGSTLPDTPRQRFANISWVEADPGSGISVHTQTVDFVGPQPPGKNSVIRIFNGRSQIHVDGSGRVLVTGGGEFTLAGFLEADASALQGIDPDDRGAFQRFVQATEVGPPPTPPPSEAQP